MGGIFTRGPGLTIIEATAVAPEGRISPEDVGIWDDEHAEKLRPLVEFAHSQNQKIAIQIAHAGRKASTIVPWLPGTSLAGVEQGGWPDNVVGPSDVPFAEDYPKPRALTKADIKDIVQKFVDAAKRAVNVGFEYVYPIRCLAATLIVLQRNRDPLCAWIPPFFIPVPDVQQTHRRIRRQLREPNASYSRSR